MQRDSQWANRSFVPLTHSFILFFILSPQGWYRRGVALSNLARYEEAMVAFQKCLDMNSSSKDYQQQYDQAKKDLYKGLTDSEILKMEGNEVRNNTHGK